MKNEILQATKESLTITSMVAIFFLVGSYISTFASL